MFFCGLLRFLEMERVIPDTLKRLLEDANFPTLQPKLFTAKLGQAAGKKCCLFPGAEIAVAAHRLHLLGQQEGCTQPFFGHFGVCRGLPTIEGLFNRRFRRCFSIMASDDLISQCKTSINCIITTITAITIVTILKPASPR